MEELDDHQNIINSIVYDPSEDKVIGVTDYNCHVLLYHDFEHG